MTFREITRYSMTQMESNKPSAWISVAGSRCIIWVHRDLCKLCRWEGLQRILVRIGEAEDAGTVQLVPTDGLAGFLLMDERHRTKRGVRVKSWAGLPHSLSTVRCEALILLDADRPATLEIKLPRWENADG